MRIPVAIGTLVAALAFPTFAAADDAIVVQRVPGLDRTERADLRADAGVRLEAMLPLRDTEVVVAKDGDVEGAIAALEADADVVFAEPDTAVFPATGDPSLANQWGLHNGGQTIFGTPGTADADIDAPEAWAVTRGAGATVAVVDTGVELTHPDLVGQFWSNPGESGGGRETNGIDDDGNGRVDDWRGWDFVNNDNTIDTQGNFHGTHVAGTIAAATGNGVGVAGVAPDAKVLPVKIFGAPGSTAPSSAIATAFDYAGSLGVDVVNASLGGMGTSQVITNAMNAHPNTLYVVSAGNDGDNAASYFPCNSTAANVVCVGASTNVDEPADFSNVSATAVDLFAPGAYVLSTDAERRLHLRERHVDGRAARERRRGAARREGPGRDGRPDARGAAGVGRREGAVRRAVGHGRTAERGRGARRAAGLLDAAAGGHARPGSHADADAARPCARRRRSAHPRPRSSSRCGSWGPSRRGARRRSPTCSAPTPPSPR